MDSITISEKDITLAARKIHAAMDEPDDYTPAQIADATRRWIEEKVEGLLEYPAAAAHRSPTDSSFSRTLFAVVRETNATK